jgi:hypothetical protein
MPPVKAFWRATALTLAFVVWSSCGPTPFVVVHHARSECGDYAFLLELKTPATVPFVYELVVADEPLRPRARRDWIWKSSSVPPLGLEWKGCSGLQVTVAKVIVWESGDRSDFSYYLPYIETRASKVVVETLVLEEVERVAPGEYVFGAESFTWKPLPASGPSSESPKQ